MCFTKKQKQKQNNNNNKKHTSKNLISYDNFCGIVVRRPSYHILSHLFSLAGDTDKEENQ